MFFESCVWSEVFVFTGREGVGMRPFIPFREEGDKLPAFPTNKRHHSDRPDPTGLANEYVTNGQHSTISLSHRQPLLEWLRISSAAWNTTNTSSVKKLGNGRQLVVSHVAPRWDVYIALNDETITHRHNGQLTSRRRKDTVSLRIDRISILSRRG